MSFDKIHLSISKGDLVAVRERFPPELHLKEVETDYDLLQLLIRIVGDKYEWHLRQEYHDDPALDRLIRVLQDPESRLWLFRHKREIVGFCCAALVEPNLVQRFNMASGQVMEIYKIGLFDEHTKHGWGRFFVPAVMDELFQTYQTIYLNTRDTNHHRVVPFYERLGAQVIETETLPDDILPADIGLRPQ